MVFIGDGRYELPDNLAYTKQFLYINPENGRIGISELGYAIFSSAKELQFLDIEQVAKDDPFAKLATANGTITLRAPVSGKILKINQASLSDLKKDSYNEGFLLQVKPANLEEDLKGLISGDKVKQWGDEQVQFLIAGEYMFKIIEVGDSSVGKTAIKVRFTDNYFKRDLKSTLGVDFGSRVLNVEYVPEDVMTENSRKLKVNMTVWDFGGQKIYANQRKMYYNQAKGCLLVYDVTNPASFKSLPEWIKEIEENAGKIPILLIGNKVDLTAERKVPSTEAQKFAQKNGFLFFESSAKDGTGVTDAFEALTLEIYKKTLKHS